MHSLLNIKQMLKRELKRRKLDSKRKPKRLKKEKQLMPQP